jgi:hypothetical protein
MMTLRTLMLAAAWMIAAPAFGHETTGPNGGRLVDAGDLHVELVASPSQVMVFITDAGEKPVPASGFKGLAILVAGGQAQRIALEPDQDNRLTGKSDVELPADVKGAVQLTAPGGKTAQGQFN